MQLSEQLLIDMAKSIICSIASLTHAENSIVNNKTSLLHPDFSENALFSVSSDNGKPSPPLPSSSASFMVERRRSSHQVQHVAASSATPMNSDQFASAPLPLDDNVQPYKNTGQISDKIRMRSEKSKRSSSSSRRRRRKFDKSIVRRNLNDTLLQKIMATYYPDKIYALFVASKNRKQHAVSKPSSEEDALNIDEQLELYVEWGALRYAPVHKSMAKKKVKTLKTILPYALMKKRYPEVVIRFYEEHLRFLDMTTSPGSATLLYDAASDAELSAINSETKLQEEDDDVNAFADHDDAHAFEQGG